MKDTAYITSKSKGYDSYTATKKPIVVILIVAIIIVIALNLINSIIIN